MSLPFDEFHQTVSIAEAAKRTASSQDHYFHDPQVRERITATRSSAWRRIDGGLARAGRRVRPPARQRDEQHEPGVRPRAGPPGEGPVLLFPGDAQVGNWQSWFGTVEHRGGDSARTWPGRSAAASRHRRATCCDRTVLYKVGHHGSHNATLRDQGLEIMGSETAGELVAMIPVDEYVAQVKAGYGEMPLPSLVKDLLIRTGGRVMRNDEDWPSPKPVPHATRDGVVGGCAIQKGFGEHESELYIEYTVH